MLSTKDWERLNDLFHRACELPEIKREAFAHAQIGGQPEVLEELLRMLAVEASATPAAHALGNTAIAHELAGQALAQLQDSTPEHDTTRADLLAILGAPAVPPASSTP